MTKRVLRAWSVVLLAIGFVATGTQVASAAPIPIQRMYDDAKCRSNGNYFRVFSDDHPSAPLCFTGTGSLNVGIYRVTKVESGSFRGSVNADGPATVTFEPGTVFTAWHRGRAALNRVTLTASLVCPRGC
jgi:hypothetical protein